MNAARLAKGCAPVWMWPATAVGAKEADAVPLLTMPVVVCNDDGYRGTRWSHETVKLPPIHWLTVLPII
jgi:hypothetical protein